MSDPQARQCAQCRGVARGIGDHLQTIRTDIADRVTSYGIPGMVVDGNDVVAVYEAVGEAVVRARKGKGPTLIECKTYRHRGHFKGDPQVYKPKEEIEEWMKKNPIPRFKEQLLKMGVLTEEQSLLW